MNNGIKEYPHKPSMDVFEENYKAAMDRLTPQANLTEELIAEASDYFLPLNAHAALECAFRAYALEQPKSVVLEFLQEAKGSYQLAFDKGSPLNLGDFVNVLSLALVLGDKAYLGWLSELDRSRYTNPDVEYHEVLYLSAECQANLAAGHHDIAREKLINAQAILANAKVNQIIREEANTVLLIEQAIIEQTQDGFTHAVSSRIQYQAKKFLNPRIRHMAEGALDLRTLGLIRLGIAMGLNCPVESPYLPMILLEP